MATVALKIYGMDCADEIGILKREFSFFPHITDLAFDLLNSKVVVTYAEDSLTAETLIQIVNRTGMRAETYSEERAIDRHGTTWERWGRTILTTTSGALVAVGFLSHIALSGMGAAIASESAPYISRFLYLFATVAGAWFVAPKAWFALKRIRPDMNLLMIVAVIGAIAIGEWFEAATVSFLFALSLSLESWSVTRARRAVAALMELAPTQARVLGRSGEENLVDSGVVQIGSRILVKPGERIPLDGKVVAGESSVNQAPITGESMPIEKRVGDNLFAGSINGEGTIELESSKSAGESTISRIVKLVEEAQKQRSPSEQWVERFARYYTPLVMVLALLVLLLPPLIFGGSWEAWIYNSLVLLVIACPCALVISTPVSIVSSLVAAAKNGILIKGGPYVELPAHLQVIAMDKTGTLTEGKPEVSEVVPLSGHSEDELLSIAAAIELRSEHPLGEAIVRHAKSKNLNPAPVSDYQAIKGKGATARLNGHAVWVGSHKYLEERGEETTEMHTTLERLSSGGRSVVVIGEDGHVCGFISLADKLRSGVKDVLLQLKAQGVKKIVMLTGDNAPTAALIGAQAGIDDIRAELLPEDKVRIVEELVKQYDTVAMVGDGVNDAPALARSNLGIAMGVGGSDAALETADIALMRDDLSRLPWLINHSKRTLRTIRQNIAASIGVKIVFAVLTLGGLASLWGAIASDMGVSLLVVANALRLIRTDSV